MSHYYKPRWTLFVDLLRKCLIDKKTFNQTQFDEIVFEKVEQFFANQTNDFSTEPKGKKLIKKP